MMRVVGAPVLDRVERRERHRAAIHAACVRVGLTCPALAIECGVGLEQAKTWLKPGMSNAMPAWALDHLRTARPDFAAALAHELRGFEALEAPVLDDAAALRVVRLYSEASAVIASPARHTPEGAARALVLTARIEGEHRTVVRALRDVTEARRAA